MLYVTILSGPLFETAAPQDTMTQETTRPRFEVTARLENPSSEEPHDVIGLSPSTVTFLCSEPPGIGTEVDLVVHLPALRSSVRAMGRVLFRNRSEPADLGVQLATVDGNGQELLRRYLDQVLAVATC